MPSKCYIMHTYSLGGGPTYLEQLKSEHILAQIIAVFKEQLVNLVVPPPEGVRVRPHDPQGALL